MNRLTKPLIGLSLVAALGACDDTDDGGKTCPDTPGTICPWAGTGAPGFDGDGKSLKESRFYWPADVSFTSTGAYILDWNNHRVRRLQDDGTLQTVIGTDFVGDGPEDLSDLTPEGAVGTTVHLNHPTQIHELADGKIMLVAWHNHKLRIFDPATGRVTVMCGRGAGFEGDGGPAADARLNQPVAAALAPDGSLYLLDQRNQRIRHLLAPLGEGAIETVVGNGMPGFAGDGGDPLEAQVSFPTGSNPPPGGGITLGPDGKLYFSDILNQRVRVVDFAANRIDTLYGDGSTEKLNNPRDLAFGPDGRLYVADERNHRVLAIGVEDGAAEVVAGTGAAGDTGDGGAAAAAQLNGPTGVTFDDAGDLYIADAQNHRIRVVRQPGSK